MNATGVEAGSRGRQVFEDHREAQLAGFGALVLTSGFRPSYVDWIQFPVFDEVGVATGQAGAPGELDAGLAAAHHQDLAAREAVRVAVVGRVDDCLVVGERPSAGRTVRRLVGAGADDDLVGVERSVTGLQPDPVADPGRIRSTRTPQRISPQ